MSKQHKNYDSFYNKHKDDVVETQVKPNEIVEHTAEEYLPKPEEEVQEELGKPEEPMTIVEVVGAPRVNLREAPNKDAKVLKVYNSGSKFTMIDEQNGWYKITDGTIAGTGYMMKQYLKKV